MNRWIDRCFGPFRVLGGGREGGFFSLRDSLGPLLPGDPAADALPVKDSSSMRAAGGAGGGGGKEEAAAAGYHARGGKAIEVRRVDPTTGAQLSPWTCFSSQVAASRAIEQLSTSMVKILVKGAKPHHNGFEVRVCDEASDGDGGGDDDDDDDDGSDEEEDESDDGSDSGDDSDTWEERMMGTPAGPVVAAKTGLDVVAFFEGRKAGWYRGTIRSAKTGREPIARVRFNDGELFDVRLSKVGRSESVGRSERAWAAAAVGQARGGGRSLRVRCDLVETRRVKEVGGRRA